MISLRQLELADWQEKNFGKNGSTSNAIWCLAGMVEEIGELAHWLLKREQRIRETVDGRDCKEEIGDAFADVVIYGIQAMTCEGIDAEEILVKTMEKVLNRDWKNNPSGMGETQHKGKEK